MVEFLANGSRIVTGVPPMSEATGVVPLPSEPKGRLHAFACEHLTDCQFLTYGELEQRVRDTTFAHSSALPHSPERATAKIMSRWQQVDEDGHFVIRPNFAYCS